MYFQICTHTFFERVKNFFEKVNKQLLLKFSQQQQYLNKFEIYKDKQPPPLFLEPILHIIIIIEEKLVKAKKV